MASPKPYFVKKMENRAYGIMMLLKRGADMKALPSGFLKSQGDTDAYLELERWLGAVDKGLWVNTGRKEQREREVLDRFNRL
jgi:hypothetical protein